MMDSCTIWLSNKAALSVIWTEEEQEAVRKNLADPHIRWLRIGDRWLAVAHIVEIKFVPPTP